LPRRRSTIWLPRLRGGDHYIMEERPAEVSTALLELLASSRVNLGEAGTQAG
jgi:hypothetical protein